MSNAPSADSPLRGVAFMVAAAACYAGMGAMVKTAGADYPSMVIVFARSVVIATAGAVLLKVRRASWKPGNLRLITLRSVSGFAAMATYYYALTQIPLGSAVTIQFTSPLFVALFAGIFLKERVGWVTVTCIVVALSGAVVIVSPGSDAFEPAALLVVVSAALAGVAYVYVRQLRKTDEPETIVFHFALFALLFSAPGVAWADHWPGLGELLALLGVGLFAMGGQTFMTYAFRFGEAAFVSAFTYATVIFSGVLGLLMFGEVPTGRSYAGAGMVIGAGVVLTLSKRREQRRAAMATR